MGQQRQLPLMQHLEGVKNILKTIHADAIGSRIAVPDNGMDDLYAKASDKIMTVYRKIGQDTTSDYLKYEMPSGTPLEDPLDKTIIQGRLAAVRSDLMKFRETVKDKGFSISNYKGETFKIDNNTKSVITKLIGDLDELIDLHTEE